MKILNHSCFFINVAMAFESKLRLRPGRHEFWFDCGGDILVSYVVASRFSQPWIHNVICIDLKISEVLDSMSGTMLVEHYRKRRFSVLSYLEKGTLFIKLILRAYSPKAYYSHTCTFLFDA